MYTGDEGTYGDIPAQIIWKPLPVNVVMDEDMSATFECVANARFVNLLDCVMELKYQCNIR